MRILRRCAGPLTPIVLLFAVTLAGLSASRFVLMWCSWDRVYPVVGSWWILPIGLRLDVMTLSWLLLPPVIVLLAWPDIGVRSRDAIVAANLACVAGTLFFFEVATYPFLAQFDSRPNRIFLDYLAYPREVVATVWADHRLAVAVGLVGVAVVVSYVWRETRRMLAEAPSWSWGRRLAVAPAVSLVLMLSARSSLGLRGGNISTAAFAGDHLVNELALDSTYAIGFALEARRNEADPDALYGSLPREEAVVRVRAQMLLPAQAFTREDNPLFHAQASATPRLRPFNLVIFLQESLGAEYVGTLGGLPLTPNLDGLATEGWLFTNLASTGTRTVRGIEAIVSGFLPTPGNSIVKLGLAQGGFFTLADLLRRRGYRTEFLYGGESDFDNMRGFFLNNGFERVIDESAFETPAFRGTWGVSDEDLVRRANEVFVAHGDHPFFALMLSTSNHPPFEFPPGRIELFESPASTVHNAMRYADYAIGEFFRLAKREAYWHNTLFLVIADHNTRVFGRDLVPLDRFRIPALILGPGVAARRDGTLASQVDLPPTLLDLIGLDVESPLVGRDLVSVPAGTPGHAFMQYDLANAYRVGDHVVIHEPYKAPQQFEYAGGRLRPEPLDPELCRDALAHVQVPAMLYRERRYRLIDVPER